MPTSRKFVLLFTSSWLSLLIGFTLSFIFTGITSLSLAQNSGRLGGFAIRDYLSVIDVSAVSNAIGGFLGSLRLNTIGFILFWVLIGFITYNIVYLLRGSVDESVGFARQLHYVHAQPGAMRRKVALRLLLLFVALCLWVAFSLLFAWVILPASLSSIDHCITEGGSALYILLGFALVFAASHITTVLLRFTLLKARLTRQDT